ncbi:MAG: SPOR domain-containing protein [Rhodobacteraceae bacterium CG17_big_fil_post_rev_8_21_14_2_50_63_15]|nr:SPOR domain-containing protein [Roseovarius sp.]PIV79018.1 MAG: SPOR domain-containing protein [Rhodobacteraceae bacterium CG17_big_fil_post_rev_8_21_14_2_50_63_15]
MAQFQDARMEAGLGRTATFARFTHIAGATLSLALIAGIGVWGYRLILRDVSGVPVVRAIEGPMRVQPEDPGGSATDHQGLSVNAIAADGVAADPADRLILAPPPLELSLEDVPHGAAPAKVSDATPRAEAGDPAPEPEAERMLKVAAVPAEDAADDLDADAGADLSSKDPGFVQPTPVTGGLGQSLRPRPRPEMSGTLPEAVARAVASAQSAGGVTEIDPERIPAGTRLAQLGAFDSPEVARAEWDRLSVKFQDYLDGKQRVVQRAESGGRTFYRLRVMGFADLSDARRFCSAMVAERAECIPVVAR